MKIIKEWFDEPRKITNRVFMLDSGIKLIHSINPASVESDFSVVMKAGAVFESLLKVPTGTAHFLEHMITGNPNTRFKTMEKLRDYEFGTKTYPRIYPNATTSRKYMYLQGSSNIGGLSRLIDYIDLNLNYPEALFDKYIERQREIVLAERSHYPKVERDSYLCYDKFLYGKVAPYFARSLSGEESDIKSVNTHHLKTFRDSNFLSENVILAMQTPEEGDLVKSEDKINRLITPISQRKSKPLELGLKPILNFLDVSSFTEPNEHGVQIFVSFYIQYQKKINYKDNISLKLLYSLILEVGNQVLREDKNLIYGISGYTAESTFNEYAKGFYVSCTKEHYNKVLEEIYRLLFEYCDSFLSSERGRKWFNSKISEYLYPVNYQISSSYAEGLAINEFDEEDPYIFKNAKKAILSMNIEDIRKYLAESRLNPPHIWINSDLEKEVAEKEVLKSLIYKQYSKN